MTKQGLFFNITAHTLIPLALQCLNPIDGEAFILLIKEGINSRHDVIITVALVSNQVSFHIGKQMSVVLNEENRERRRRRRHHHHCCRHHR